LEPNDRRKTKSTVALFPEAQVHHVRRDLLFKIVAHELAKLASKEFPSKGGVVVEYVHPRLLLPFTRLLVLNDCNNCAIIHKIK
jgi:hypothetical protein